MNIDLKKTVCGVIILFLVFCGAFILNKVLDRSADDNIIISTEAPLYSENSEEYTEQTSDESNSEEESNNFYGYLKLEESNGDVYDGYWENGNYNGKGVLTRKGGEVYDGEWIGGAFDNGTITYKINNFGGTQSVNIIHDENLNGTGKFAMILENGEIYDGEWYDWKRNGNGTLYSGKNKKIYTGLWEDDILMEGTETTLYDDGLQTYIVQIKDGFRNGKGILYDENGNIKQEEQWLDDQIIE